MSSPPATATLIKPAQRLLSIDALRGLTIAFMILVNNAGNEDASYNQLRHAAWNGCTLTDLVFPTFMFIMGASAALSIESRLGKGIPRSTILAQIIRRSLAIVLIGLLLNALPKFDLATLRYCGVLQRIGICYFFSSVALLYLRPKGVIALAAVCLIGYWLLMTRIPVPGFGMPGVNIPVLDPHGNLSTYLDRLLIPRNHLYRFDFYDPEGILSTLPSIATPCLGILAGIWLRRSDVPIGRAIRAMAFAAALLLAAGILWNLTFPLNKRLWTSSYVLFAGGFSLALLALFRWSVDLKHSFVRGIEPLVTFGVNALTAYVISEMLAIIIDSIHVKGYESLHWFLYSFIPVGIGSPAFRSLIWSLLFVAVCWLPNLYLRRRGIIIKL